MAFVSGHLKYKINEPYFGLVIFLKNVPKVFMISSYQRVNVLAINFCMVTLDGCRKFFVV